MPFRRLHSAPSHRRADTDHMPPLPLPSSRKDLRSKKARPLKHRRPPRHNRAATRALVQGSRTKHCRNTSRHPSSSTGPPPSSSPTGTRCHPRCKSRRRARWHRTERIHQQLQRMSAQSTRLPVRETKCNPLHPRFAPHTCNGKTYRRMTECNFRGSQNCPRRSSGSRCSAQKHPGKRSQCR